MIGDNLDKNLQINFIIKNNGSALEFDSSNYDLTLSEIARASLRPNCLVLEDDYIYLKKDEISYLESGKNILKIDYKRSHKQFR